MRQDRRQFRPGVTGLEARQLLSNVPATPSTVVSFKGNNHSVVSPLVMDGQGNLYGSASGGGNGSGKGVGSVFEIPAGTQKPVTLATFDGQKGYLISNVTVDAKGDVFGTISGEGGVIGNGSAFEIPAGSKTPTMLASFDNNYNQEFPHGVIEDNQGNLFGTAATGGPDGVGSIFEIARGSNTPIALAGFNQAAPAPEGLVADAQGNLFGTDAGGGSQGYGSVFELARGSHTITPLVTFGGLDGAGISNVTIDSQGNLYGTTEDGGEYGAGLVFEIARGSNTATTLASFNTLNGAEPSRAVGVVADASGNLYGVTKAGGAYNSNNGTVFELAKNSGTITTLATFKNNTGYLVNGLAIDAQGNLEGSVNGTGSNGGAIFKVVLGK